MVEQPAVFAGRCEFEARPPRGGSSTTQTPNACSHRVKSGMAQSGVTSTLPFDGARRLRAPLQDSSRLVFSAREVERSFAARQEKLDVAQARVTSPGAR